MARATEEAALDRRNKVEALALRGQSVRAIARALSADPRTIGRDLRVLARHWAREAEARSERHRLLAAGRNVEAAAWNLYERLGAGGDPNAKLGALSRVLAAQERQAAVLAQIEAASLGDELAALRAEVDALAGRTRLGSRGEGV